MGSIEYRFDRRTRQLAIGNQGEPGLLVKDRQLFLLVCCDDDEVPTYLEVTKNTSDHLEGHLKEALQLIRSECPLAGGSFNVPCFVFPFLGGGTERLFPPDAKILKEGDADQAEFAAIFDFGHPDFKHILVPKEDNPDKIDPKKPVCIKTDDGTSAWAYAFEREPARFPPQSESSIEDKSWEFLATNSSYSSRGSCRSPKATSRPRANSDPWRFNCRRAL